MPTVAAFYLFAPLPDPAGLRAPLRAVAEAAGVLGTILLAPEGVNGTIAGPAEGVEDVLAHLRALPGLGPLQAKHAQAGDMPFRRLKVRLKREIVTMGMTLDDPGAPRGTYVAPADWNALIADPDGHTLELSHGQEVALAVAARAPHVDRE